ncbi:MAG: CPBP family intramembrane metalloprotease [Eubacteriales bacterium]|nr:CPBP family intramembrane metalloprotease [Eubacteriales bacterium]
MQRSIFSRLGFALVAAWAAALLSQVVVELVFNNLFPEFYDSKYYYWAMYIFCVYVIQVPVFVLASGGRGSLKPFEIKRKITTKDFFRLIVVCISLTYVFNWVGVLFNGIISTIIGHSIVNPLDTLENTSTILGFICVGIISPFTEEIMFRGIIINKTRQYGDKIAIWFSAVAFGLFHGNFSQFFYALVLGLVFGAIAVKTNRLIYTILLHIAVNIMGSFVLPQLIENSNLLISGFGTCFLMAVIFAGIILGIRMLPYLKAGKRMQSGDVELMALNPGALSFIAISGLMFYLAITTH